MLGASILEWIQYVGCWKVYMSRHICHIGCHLLRWASWGEGTNSLYHVFHMGISHSCYIADGMINFTQSAIMSCTLAVPTTLFLHLLYHICTSCTLSAPPAPYLHPLHLICTTCTISAPPACYLHPLHHICTISAPPALSALRLHHLHLLHFLQCSCTSLEPADGIYMCLLNFNTTFLPTCECLTQVGSIKVRWNLSVCSISCFVRIPPHLVII